MICLVDETKRAQEIHEVHHLVFWLCRIFFVRETKRAHELREVHQLVCWLRIIVVFIKQSVRMNYTKCTN